MEEVHPGEISFIFHSEYQTLELKIFVLKIFTIQLLLITVYLRGKLNFKLGNEEKIMTLFVQHNQEISVIHLTIPP